MGLSNKGYTWGDCIPLAETGDPPKHWPLKQCLTLNPHTRVTGLGLRAHGQALDRTVYSWLCACCLLQNPNITLSLRTPNPQRRYILNQGSSTISSAKDALTSPQYYTRVNISRNPILILHDPVFYDYTCTNYAFVVALNYTFIVALTNPVQ